MKREIEIELVKLADKTRLLRLNDPESGLCLEKKLHPQQSVARQKERWLRAFEAMLNRELVGAS